MGGGEGTAKTKRSRPRVRAGPRPLTTESGASHGAGSMLYEFETPLARGLLERAAGGTGSCPVSVEGGGVDLERGTPHSQRATKGICSLEKNLLLVLYNIISNFQYSKSTTLPHIEASTSLQYCQQRCRFTWSVLAFTANSVEVGPVCETGPLSGRRHIAFPLPTLFGLFLPLRLPPSTPYIKVNKSNQ